MGSGDEFALYRALTKLLANHTRAFVTIDGVVTEYNDNNTCDITVNEVAYTNVPIVVNIGNQASIYPIPEIGTNCLITFRDGNRALPQIIAFDQVAKYYITTTENVYIKSPLIQFNDGANGGLVLVNDLVERLNLIEANQNAILSVLKGINIPSTPFSFTALFSAIQALTETTATEIESQVITQ